ncbi:MAG: DUF4838 domain-containing protein [Bacteroidota bacterium]|jgi:hypothetical protein
MIDDIAVKRGRDRRPALKNISLVQLRALSLGFLLFVMGPLCFAATSIRLVSNGKSSFTIFVAADAPAAVAASADTLGHYIHEISGADLPLSRLRTKKGGQIVIEVGKSSDRKFDINRLGDDGFRIKTVGKNIFMTARTVRGIRNAVYSFLEQYLGCRYFAPDAQFIPHPSSIILGNIDTTEIPPFTFRVPYYGEAFERRYIEWQRLSNEPRDSAGGIVISSDWGMWVHTLERLIPPERYFASHPEYFAYKNGIRISDQLCLSNPEVLRLATTALAVAIEQNPGRRYWSVSQMDNYGFCECADCRGVDSIEGSQSGSVIRFVNKVAAEFPEKIISTLAYQYSRKAPSHVKPAKNVNIMLCTIECDRSKPIEADTSQGSFLLDLRDWTALTHNIIVWDYVINFSHVVMPFPNFQVLQPNLRLFAKYGVKMLFEQGWPPGSGEMEELRVYLLSHLMWNPGCDAESLMHDFLGRYYGPSGKYIEQYIRLQTESLNKSDRALTLYEPPGVHSGDYLSPGMLKEYQTLLDSASAAASGDSVLARRVEMVKQSVRYATLEVAKKMVMTDGWLFEKTPSGTYAPRKDMMKILDDFTATAKKYGPPRLHESGNSPDEYSAKMREYFQRGVVNHLGVGKKIQFGISPSPKYPANGPATLVDGVRGTEDYQMLWLGWEGTDMSATVDLDTTQVITSVGVDCLDDNQSWIFFPEKIEIAVSVDGKAFVDAGMIENPDARKQVAKQTKTFLLNMPAPLHARYVRVAARNVAEVPAWRGVKGLAWVFVDEIIIR